MAILLVGAWVGITPALAASPLKWAPPVRADASSPFASPTAITAVSCPSSSFCAAVDIQGDVIASSEPTGGASAWSPTVVQAEAGFTAISCPSAQLCVAGNQLGQLFVSAEPAGGPEAWSKVTVDAKPEREIVSISCASAELCVAGDNRGNVAVSTDPTGGDEAWNLVHIDGPRNNWIRGVSCPSADLCVAVSELGEVISSTDPTGGESAWRQINVDERHTLFDVSCASKSLCVATDNYGNVVTSTDPAGGEDTWTSIHVSAGLMEDVSCVLGSLCVASGGEGGVVTSTDPTGGANAWTSTPIDLPNSHGGHYSIWDISCATQSFCVLTSSGSQVITSTEPTGDESAWAVTELEVGVNWLGSISCASRQLCVGVDNAGNAISSTDPVGWRHPWSSAHIDEHPINDISCPFEQFCAAVDTAGNVLTSTEPSGSAASWSTANVDGTFALEAISCPSAQLCVAVDKHGNVLSSTDPATAASWQITYVAEENSLEDISCPSLNICVAIDEETPLFSTNPTGGASAWVKTPFYLGHSISCPSAQLCVAVRFPPREIVFSPNPSAGVWGVTSVEEVNGVKINGLGQIGCAEGWLCITSTYSYAPSYGDVLISADPTGGNEAWVEDNAYGLPIVPPDPNIISLYTVSLTGVSCVSEEMCVLVDYVGRAMVATPAVAPENLEAPLVSGTPALGQALSCSPGSWSGEPAPELSYHWLRDGEPITNPQAATYTVQEVDAGHGVSCEVTATNGGGSASAISNALQVPPRPINITAPSLNGSSTVGQNLTCLQGSWENDPTSYAYAWRRDDSVISGQDASTYVVQRGDAGHAISCQVTATNGGGSATAGSEAVRVADVQEEPTTTAPPISNEFRILKARARSRGEIIVTLAVPPPGSLLARATISEGALRALRGGPHRSNKRPCGAWRPSGRTPAVDYGKGGATASSSGTTKLLIHPRPAIRDTLKGSGRLCVWVTVTYAPRGGVPRTKRKVVTSTA